METICRDCVFARYNGDVQYDCLLGRLNKFQKNGGIQKVKYVKLPWHSAQSLGLQLPEAITGDIVYETEIGTAKLPILKENINSVLVDEREFYRINRFCTTCRSKDSDWVKDYPQEKWTTQVLEDIRLKLSLVFYFDDSQSIDDLQNVIESGLQQTHLPHEIIVLVASNKHQIEDAKKISKLFDSLETKFNKEFETVSWRSLVITNPETLEKNLNHLIKNVKGSYFTIFKPNKQYIPSNFIEKLNTSLNYELEKFVYLDSDDFGNGTTYQTYLFNILEGNKAIKLEKTKPAVYGFREKVKYIAEFNKETDLIKSVEDFY